VGFTGGVFVASSAYGELYAVTSFLRLHTYLASCSWTKLRKAGHEGLNIRAAEKYQPLQEVEAAAMVVGIMKEPDH
jgi:hypothetical protein